MPGNHDSLTKSYQIYPSHSTSKSVDESMVLGTIKLKHRPKQNSIEKNIITVASYLDNHQHSKRDFDNDLNKNFFLDF